MVYVIYQMVSTGRVHKKGAKKLRKKLFPVFYGKKSLFAEKKNVDTNSDLNTNS